MNNKLTLNYILFLILSFVVIFGYSYLFTEPVKKTEQAETADRAVEQDPAESPREEQSQHLATAGKDKSRVSVPGVSGNTVSVDTPLYSATLDTLGGRITKFELKGYSESTDDNSPPVNLVQGPEQAIYVIPEINGFRLPDIIPFSYNGSGDLELTEGTSELELTYSDPSGISITKTLTINSDTYVIKESLRVNNPTGETIENRLRLYTNGFIEYNGRGQNSHSFDIMVNDEVKRVESKPDENKRFSGQINWFAFSEQYFTKSILPESGSAAIVELFSSDGNSNYTSVYHYPPETIPAGAYFTRNLKYYLGPKDAQTIAPAGYSLEKIVNFGWVESLAKIALKFLKMLNSYFHNYGLSIIAITVIFRVAFLPLTLRSMKSMKEMQNKMQDLKPKIDALKEKYKDDKTKQNSEMMKLYSSHGVNPLSSLGGCLPLLIQLPVFIALYDVLLYSIEMRHSPFLWISDLSRPETLFDIPFVGIPFRILPLLMGVSWFISQKMTPTTAAASESMELQMKMMQFMPIIFTVMFWGLPSGLILYWTVSNILSIGQQLYINRRVHS